MEKEKKKQIIDIFNEFVNQRYAHSSENYKNELKLEFIKFLHTKLG